MKKDIFQDDEPIFPAWQRCTAKALLLTLTMQLATPAVASLKEAFLLIHKHYNHHFIKLNM